MKIRVSGLFWLLIILFNVKLFVSCTPSACLGETTAYINAGFYRTGTGKSYTPDSITVTGIGESINKLYNQAKNISSIKLPLDASSGSCAFIMKINNITDTLFLKYSAFPHLLSKECGYTFFFSLDSCRWRGGVIDTINIRNNKITIYNEENIRIFY